MTPFSPLISSVKKSNVPESVPGPNRLTFVSGNFGSIWLKLVTFEPLFHSFLSWSVVRQSILRSLLVTTAMPSLATWTSV